jgi:hypothetical protein
MPAYVFATTPMMCSQADAEKYDGELFDYLESVKAELPSVFRRQAGLELAPELQFELRNEGTAYATGLSIMIEAPSGWSLVGEEDEAWQVELPRPPKKPGWFPIIHSDNYYLIQAIRQSRRQEAAAPVDWEVTNCRTSARFLVPRSIHGETVRLPKLYLVSNDGSWQDTGLSWKLACSELARPVEGQMGIAFSLEANEERVAEFVARLTKRCATAREEADRED